MDQNRPLQAKMDHFGPFWSREYQSPVRNIGKNQRLKTQRVKTSEILRKKNIFVETSEDFLEDRRYHFNWILE